MSGHFMSFEATASLRRDAEAFISHIQKGDSAPQNALLQRVLDAFITQCLDTYCVTPVEVVGLSPIGRKIVITAVATVRKTAQLVVGRIIRKLSNRDMQPLAEYMDEVMVRDRCNPAGIAWVAFPLDGALVEQFRAMQRQAHSSVAPQDSIILVKPFQVIADEAISYLFQEPVDMLRLGPVLSRMAQLGIDSTRTVIAGMINRTFSTMEPSQVAATLDYFCGLIGDGHSAAYIERGALELA